MLVRDQQWYLDILARYHAKVNHPAYGDIRKRGNPPSVLKAVAILRGSKACRVCRTLDHVELHHVDGNWKNYNLNNLWYYCHTCHNQAHKEIPMSHRTIWTEERVSKLRTDVNALVAKGSTKKAAYEKLESKWKIGAAHIANLCSSNLEARRAKKREYNAMRYAKMHGKAIVGSSRTFSNTSTGATMTAAEALQFYNFLKSMNITIS